MTSPIYKYIRGVGWVPEGARPEYQHEDLSIWVTSDGRRLKVVEMDDRHVLNARNMIARKLVKLRACDWCDGFREFECAECGFGKKERFESRIKAFDEELARRRLLVGFNGVIVIDTFDTF